MNLVLKDPILGAYTELYAGRSKGLESGCWINPRGHVAVHNREDIVEACKTIAEEGSGIAEESYEWTEKQIA